MAVRVLAATHGLALGSVRASSLPGWVLCGAELESEAGTVRLLLGSEERVVIAECWRRGVTLAGGSTPELLPVARAAEAFLRGDSLADLRDHHSFLTVSDLARAHERGPAEAVAEQWRRLRDRWGRDDRFPFVADLIEAAYAVPQLRQLFPYTSHFTLQFSTCTGWPYSGDIPCIEPAPQEKVYRLHQCDGYVLRNRLMGGDVIGEADDAESAITALLAHLPANVGPAVAGTADDA
jgi:hypothetical protein